MSKAEADKKCMCLFGMDSDAYAKRILKAWKECQKNQGSKPKKEECA